MPRTVVTLGINSALQILKGARDEGFGTFCLCLPQHVELYRRYDFIDRPEALARYEDIVALCQELDPERFVIVPHSSFLSRLGSAGIAALSLPYFGSREAPAWEEVRDRQRQWMARSNLKVPRQFRHIDEIDAPVVVKAGGGMRGGKQGPIEEGGNAYLERNFPRLDFIKRARVVRGR